MIPLILCYVENMLNQNNMSIKTLSDLKQFLTAAKFNDLFFAVTFPKDGLGLEDIFPYKIVSFDDHPIRELIKTDTFALLASTTEQPKRRSTSVLLKHPQTRKFIDTYHQYEPNILTYKPSPSLESICQKNNWRLLANPAKLNREFEHKIKFAQYLTDLNLPQPDYEIKKLNDIEYDYFADHFGPKFFLQFPRGFAGSTTFLIKNATDLSSVKVKFLNYPAKISRQIVGPTYSLNACIVHPTVNPNNIIIQRPFYQITDIPELNPSPGGTCGNIYSTDLQVIADLKQLFDDARKFGQLLSQHGYRGIFGLDFVIDAATGQHYFIECNPRLTASIPMITKLQVQNNEVPLLALHLMEFLDLDYQLADSAIAPINQNPTIGSQIIFRNITPEPQATPITLKSGIYQVNSQKSLVPSKVKVKSIYKIKDLLLSQTGTLEYLRPGKDILDIQKKDEFLILSEPADKIISPGIEYLRIQCLF